MPNWFQRCPYGEEHIERLPGSTHQTDLFDHFSPVLSRNRDMALDPNEEAIMSAQLPSPDRRKVLAASVAVAASGFLPTQAQAATANEAIRPFKVSFPEDELDELRKRIKATRWPERETKQNRQLCRRSNLERILRSDCSSRSMPASLSAMPRWAPPMALPSLCCTAGLTTSTVLSMWPLS